MNSRTKYLVLILYSLFSELFYIPADAQLSFRIGPELGISIAEPQKRNPFTEPGKKLETASPSFGIDYAVKITRHFEIRSGFKYENIGYSLRDETYKSIERLKYSRLCMPVEACLVTSNQRLKMIIFSGYTPNYLLRGIYSSRQDGIGSSVTDLFQMQINPARFTGQFTAGVGVEYSGIAFIASYSMGKHLEAGEIWEETRYWQGVPIGVRHHEIIYSLDNDSFNLSVTYFLNLGRRHQALNTDIL